MKSVLITFDQAHYVRIIELLDKLLSGVLLFRTDERTWFQDRGTPLWQSCMAFHVFCHYNRCRG